MHILIYSVHLAILKLFYFKFLCDDMPIRKFKIELPDLEN